MINFVVTFRRRKVVISATLCLQFVIISSCFFAVYSYIYWFPYPSPIVKPFLDPKLRWPTEQVRRWAENGNFDPGFWEYFTRDPERSIPDGNVIVSPADGVFVFYERSNTSQTIVIGMSYWDVHVQRAPLDGVVKSVSYTGDTYMDGEGKDQVYLREKLSPVQGVIHLETKQGLMVIRLITSVSARRVQVWVREGQRVKKGDRIGRILAGSTVALEMPLAMNIEPTVRSRVIAGETVLCQF